MILYIKHGPVVTSEGLKVKRKAEEMRYPEPTFCKSLLLSPPRHFARSETSELKAAGAQGNGSTCMMSQL